MESWMLSEEQAVALSLAGWIVASSLENRCGIMQWKHGKNLKND